MCPRTHNIGTDTGNMLMKTNAPSREGYQMKPEYGIIDIIANVAVMATLAIVIVAF